MEFTEYSNWEIFPELLGHIMENPDDRMYDDAMQVIRSFGIEKEIEFDGYFKQRWEDSANTIINFDEDYFDDDDRTELYVLLCALVDEDIFQSLHYTYHVLLVQDLTKEMIQQKIDFLTKEKGVRF